jgi:hypothetical protein
MSYVSQLEQKFGHFKTTCGQKIVFTSDVCCQKSRGHKAVKSGRNTNLHWDYNLTKNNSILKESGCDLC